MVRRRRALVLVVAALVLTVVCGAGVDGDDTTAPTDGADMGHGAWSPVAEGVEDVAVGARSLEFEPALITVKAGEDIAMVLSSADSLHTSHWTTSTFTSRSRRARRRWAGSARVSRAATPSTARWRGTATWACRARWWWRRELVIEVRSLTKRFGAHHAVDELSFAAPRAG